MQTARQDKAAIVSETTDDKGILLSWRVNLSSRNGFVKSGLALCTMLAILAVGALLYDNLVLVLISAGIFFIATADYFFPMKFWITSEAAYRRTIFGTKFIRWSKVVHCYLDDKGVKLSPLAKPSRAEAFRGLFLYFGDNRNELVETVRNLSS